METPLITIAIPVYNVSKYIERSLLSALSQTYENLEIIVVDDKGSDNSMDIVRNIITSHPRGKDVQIIEHERNLGIGATRNTSIANAQGEYIMFMDSDDYIPENCILTLYNLITTTTSDIAIGSFWHVPIGNGKSYPHQLSDNIIIDKDAYYQFYKSGQFYVQTWNKLYRLNLLRDSAIYCIPANTNEDVFFSFQLFNAVSKIATTSKFTYYYSVGDPNAVTFNMRRNNIDEKRLNQFIGILNEMYNHPLIKDNDGMKTYFLENKAALIRDVACARNINNNQKQYYLNSIPSYDAIDFTQVMKSLPGNLNKYLYRNPITTARIEFYFSIPKRIFRKLKSIISSI